MNRRSKTILISGVIALFATVIISLLCINDWSGLTGIAFGTMLWSEIVLFGGLMFIEWISKKTEQLVIRSALYTVISAYAVINFCISVIYLAFFKEANTSFAVIQVAMLAIAAIVIIISLTASKSVHEANEQTMRTVGNAESMIERLNKLAICPKCEQFAPTLKKMSEDLRFTDISKSVTEDAEICDAISAIEVEIGSMNDTTPENIKTILVHLNSLISQRKVSVNALNKGRI